MRTIITGAGSGIGRSVALLAAERSRVGDEHALVLVDRDRDAVDVVADEVSKYDVQCIALTLDLREPAVPHEIVARAESELGGVDAVVSNAGTIAAGLLKDLDIAAYEFIFELNTRATWLLGKAAHSALSRSRGAIVATASISSEHPTPPLGAYSASKAALVMLVRQMALEWGPDGIRCNCVSPGPTVTGLTRGVFGDPSDPRQRRNRELREAMVPLRKVAHPDDIAEAILFLAGPQASHITGVNLVVDGGLSLTLMPASGGGSGYPEDE